MKRHVLCGVLMCVGFAAPSVAAAGPAGHHEEAAPGTGKPVNAMCPIGKEAIVPSVGTIDYKGHTIGFCCPGCSEEFLAWDENARDGFVAAAMAGHEPPAEAPAAVAWSEPYALDTCPVSGQKLGSMGDPVIKVYGGREVRLCCSGCIDKFEADPEGYFKAIDAKIIADQMPLYPVSTCVVSGEPLVEDGEDIAINTVYGNRLVRLCCTMCKREFAEDPAAFITKLDAAAADAQREHYPLSTCPVSGAALGSMGDPVETVVAGRLIRLCCSGCLPKVAANPLPYITAVDTAWAEAHEKMGDAGMMSGDGGDGDHGSMSHDDHQGHSK